MLLNMYGHGSLCVCVCVCAHMWAHLRMRARLHAHMCAHTYVCMYACKHASFYACCKRVRAHVRERNARARECVAGLCVRERHVIVARRPG